ncbi:hypothetical protein B0H14DRAFT_3890419 [Mycena olivaceomarginata]|nr:hypothetical protein B0H14DRAFT_3890419 [Mycena olivaceomarginata]
MDIDLRFALIFLRNRFESFLYNAASVYKSINSARSLLWAGFLFPAVCLPTSDNGSSQKYTALDRALVLPVTQRRQPRVHGEPAGFPPVSPTKSTATAKSAKSAGAKSGRRFAFWTQGKGTPLASPTKAGREGRGRGGERVQSAEFPTRFACCDQRLTPTPTRASLGLPSYTNLNSSQTNLMGGSTAKLTASNLSSLEMDLGGAPRRPLPGGGSDASASSGSRISVAAFREVHAQRQGAGAESGAGHQQRPQPRQGREREQQTPTKGSPPPAKTTPGKHYQAPAHFNSSNPQQQGQPRKTSGHTRQPQVQWDSETSQSLVGWWARAW